MYQLTYLTIKCELVGPISSYSGYATTCHAKFVTFATKHSTRYNVFINCYFNGVSLLVFIISLFLENLTLSNNKFLAPSKFHQTKSNQDLCLSNIYKLHTYCIFLKYSTIIKTIYCTP